MTESRSKYFIVLILIVLFVAPGVLAYLFYNHSSWISGAKVNKGMLLSPPEQIHILATEPKWRIIYWNPGKCGQTCLANVDLLARVHLALGRRLYEVQPWLILQDKVQPLKQNKINFIKDRNFHLAYINEEQQQLQPALGVAPQIWLASPENYLILTYATIFNPDHLFKDLKVLLNNSKKESS